MGSGSTCAVSGCYNNSRKLKNFSESICLQHKKVRQLCPCPVPYALYSMPRARKEAWLSALRLTHPPKRVNVCSFHFFDKRPTDLHPNPELYLGNDTHCARDQPPSSRRRNTAVTANVDEDDQPPPKKKRKTVLMANVNKYNQPLLKMKRRIPHASYHAGMFSPAHLPFLGSGQKEWQELVRHDHDYCDTDGSKGVREAIPPCDESGISDSLFFTGISLDVFNILVSTLEESASHDFTMSVRDQILMTLMKLKTNCTVRDLGILFHVSQVAANQVISYWIDKLDEVLRPLIVWLPKETIQATMPEAMKEEFPNTTCMVDCIEVRLQRPHYVDKVKYQVAVAPCGLIMFVSAAQGKRRTDKFITMNSGILKYLKPADEVIAVRGFTINDLLFWRKVKLVIHYFGQETKRRDHVGVHAERAFRRLKVFKILTQVASRALSPKLNKILRICAALVNLREDLMNDPLV